MQLFGFSINRADDETKNQPSFTNKVDDDGALQVTTGGNGLGHFGRALIDMQGEATSEAELVSLYRYMEQHPEISKAVDDVVNEAIVISDKDESVEINLDDTDLSQNVKDKIVEEFDIALNLLDFSNKGYDIFHRWYVDGRINYHMIIDTKYPKKGIQELRVVDPRKLRKVREIEEEKDSKTDAILKTVKSEYYVYTDNGFMRNGGIGGAGNGNKSAGSVTGGNSSVNGVRIASDSICRVTSGLLNEYNTLVLSHLHKAMKAMNQLKMLEDAAVIYRISRAPERRIFYIDVGNLPKAKAEQHLRDMMVKHKNRVVYDATTGEVKDDRKHMTMLEDFWLPRRDGGKGTEITTLPGGQSLGEMDDVLYFQKNLYKALGVPISRMETDAGFSMGRTSEISRDEVKFAKFIRRLRSRFSILFDEILEKQLVLKCIMTPEEFKSIKNRIRYDFQEDNYFEELKRTEILRERTQTLSDVSEYVGVYYSKDWVRKNILMQSEEDSREQDDLIAKEAKEAESDQTSENEDDENDNY